MAQYLHTVKFFNKNKQLQIINKNKYLTLARFLLKQFFTKKVNKNKYLKLFSLF